METSSDLSAWTGKTVYGTGVNSVITDWYHHGANCYKTDSPDENNFASIYKTIANTLITFSRFYFRADALPDNSTVPIAYFDCGGGVRYFLKISGSGRKLQIVSTIMATKTSATGISLDTDYCIEVLVDGTDDNGTLTVWLNGAELADISTTGFDGYGVGMQQFHIGVPDTARNFLAQVTLYFDCIIINTEYNGPEVSGIPASLKWIPHAAV